MPSFQGPSLTLSSVNFGVQSTEFGREGLALVFEPDADEVTGVFVTVCGGGSCWGRVSAGSCCEQAQETGEETQC